MPNRVDSERLSRDNLLETLLSEHSRQTNGISQMLSELQGNINLLIVLLLGIVAVAVEPKRRSLFGLIPTLILLFLSLETHRHWTIRVTGVYVGLIEDRINNLAGERLLAWSAAANNYLKWMSTFRLKERGTGRWLLNLNPVIIVVPALSLVFLFLLGLAVGGSFILSGLALRLPWRIVLLVVYESFHLVVAFLVLRNTLAQQERVLAVVRAELKLAVSQSHAGSRNKGSLGEETPRGGQGSPANSEDLSEDHQVLSRTELDQP